MSITTKNNNNFDILRLVLASTVFFFHMGVLNNDSLLSQLPGKVAVDGFFVISGYLIVKSYLSKKSLTSYTISRVLRVYPLYFFVVTTSFLIGLIQYSGGFFEYLDAGATDYLAANYFLLNFLHPTLPELFTDNHIQSVNGSLWTIKVEVMFYASIPVIYGLISRFINKKYLTIMVGLSSILASLLIGYAIQEYQLNPSLNNQLPSLMIYFMVGAFFNFYEPKNLDAKHLLILLPAMYITRDYILIYPIITGLAVYIIAFKVKVISISKKVGDLSYGIYIWHFPVLQTLIVIGAFENFAIGLISSTFIVYLLSYLSWHLIESPAIRSHKKFYKNNNV